METTEDKSWAVGMSQVDFNIEFEKRNPNSDVIPDVILWLQDHQVENRMIDPFELETLEFEPRTTEQSEKQKPKMIFCPGCKREWEAKKRGSQLGRTAHMKHCKALLNVKL